MIERRFGRRMRHGTRVVSGRGIRYSGIDVNRGLRPALGRAGLWPLRFHDLRHCYASLVIDAGETLPGVSRLMGHSRTEITTDADGHRPRAASHEPPGRPAQLRVVGELNCPPPHRGIGRSPLAFMRSVTRDQG